jgi:hypothetical protein
MMETQAQLRKVGITLDMEWSSTRRTTPASAGHDPIVHYSAARFPVADVYPRSSTIRAASQVRRPR